MSSVKQGQSFLDKVLEQTGSIENALEMAILNGISITDHSKKEEVYKAPVATKKAVVNFFKQTNEPATDISNQSKKENKVVDDGIGDMIIETTFIVR